MRIILIRLLLWRVMGRLVLALIIDKMPSLLMLSDCYFWILFVFLMNSFLSICFVLGVHWGHAEDSSGTKCRFVMTQFPVNHFTINSFREFILRLLLK